MIPKVSLDLFHTDEDDDQHAVMIFFHLLRGLLLDQGRVQDPLVDHDDLHDVLDDQDLDQDVLDFQDLVQDDLQSISNDGNFPGD